MPALVGSGTIFERQRHFRLDAADGIVRRCEEPVRRLADHLLGRPAHRALGTQIPVGDDTRRVTNNDGEIHGAVENSVSAKRTVNLALASAKPRDFSF